MYIRKKYFILLYILMIISLAIMSCSHDSSDDDETYSLSITVSPEGAGSVSVSPEQEGYASGTVVTLTVNENESYVFDHWEGHLAGNESTSSIVMDSDKSIAAVFLQKQKWNFLVYLDADNNLEEFGIEDFNEMEVIGSTANVDIFVLFDRIDKYDTSNGDWTGTRLYRVTKDTDTATINSELLLDYGELDMSHPDTLRDFIIYCTNQYPYRYTVLTLWNHGDGIWPKNVCRAGEKEKKGSGKRPKNNLMENGRGICWDDTTGGGDWSCLTSDEVVLALMQARAVTNQKIDVINMDACLMQFLEDAYEWRNEIYYLVGSQETVPGDGNDYTIILEYLISNPGITAGDMAVTLVDAYYESYNGSGRSTTYSALSLGPEFNNLISAFSGFADALLNTTDMAGVLDSWNHTTWFTYWEYNDLYDFTNETANRVTDPAVISAAETLKAAINNVVIHYRNTGMYDGLAYGLSILLPDAGGWQFYSEDNQYVTFKLSADTNWNEFILKFVDYTN